MAKSSTSFEPGQSGNPGGRPKAAIAMRDKIRERGDDIREFLFDVMDNKVEDCPDVPMPQRVLAAKTLQEFGYGKAPATVKIEDGNSIEQQLIELIKSLDDKPKPTEPQTPSAEEADTRH